MTVEVITTVLLAASASAPAGAYDLTDLPTCHDELSLPTSDTSNDPFLSRAITQASAAIASYCNRVFAVETVRDLIYPQQDPYPWQVPGLIDPLQLSRWPIVNPAVISFTGNTHGNTTVDGIASTVGLLAGMPVTSSDGTVATTIASVSTGSIVLTAVASNTQSALALTAGVQAVQTLSAPSSGGGSTQTLVYGQDFTIDPARGWLLRLNSFTGVSCGWEAIPVMVQYQAGYAAIPPDLVDACLRLVTARFRARARDPMLVERNQPALGSERYWVGPTPGQNGALPPEIQALVESYRVPVVA